MQVSFQNMGNFETHSFCCLNIDSNITSRVNNSTIFFSTQKIRTMGNFCYIKLFDIHKINSSINNKISKRQWLQPLKKAVSLFLRLSNNLYFDNPLRSSTWR